MILVINSGSSSLKFKLFDQKLRPLASGIVERIGLDAPFLSYAWGKDAAKVAFEAVPDHADALKRVTAALASRGLDLSAIRAVGHRVVHGGERFVEPTLITPAVIAKLKTYNKLAPLHNPPNLMGIEAVQSALPGARSVAVFDTAFYRKMPDYAYMYALPYELYEEHQVRKYGFHGISHEYVAGEAAKTLKKPLSKLKLITCHLGSGASITAVKNGVAVDTSMGFTPLEGLTMSTRCGDIDPEIPVWLIRELKMTPDQVDDLMNTQSGTLGICGHKDMRDVIEGARKGEKRSRLALAMFVYDVVRYIGQFMAVMGGCDAVVLTAGVGERSAIVRNLIMKWLKPFKLKALVVPTDEEGMIARQTAALLKLK